jgi:hypothetical protein
LVINYLFIDRKNAIKLGLLNGHRIFYDLQSLANPAKTEFLLYFIMFFAGFAEVC